MPQSRLPGVKPDKAAEAEVRRANFERLKSRVDKISQKEDPIRQITQDPYVLLSLQELFEEAARYGLNRDGNYGMLLIGGQAVGNIAGPHRFTGDIDLVVSEESRNSFLSILQKLGYTWTKRARFGGITASKTINEHGNPVVIPLTADFGHVFDMSSGQTYVLKESFSTPHIGKVEAYWDETLYAEGIVGVNAREVLILKLMTEAEQRSKDLIDIGHLANTRTFKHLGDADAAVIAKLVCASSEELARSIVRKITEKFLADGGVSFARAFSDWFDHVSRNFRQVKELAREPKEAERLKRLIGWFPTPKMLDARIVRTEATKHLYDDFKEREALIRFMGMVQLEIMRILDNGQAAPEPKK